MNELSLLEQCAERPMISRELLAEKLLPLLAQKARERAIHDTRSLREEDAEALLHGLVYALETHMAAENLPQEALEGDIFRLYDRALETLRALLERARRLYPAVQGALPAYASRALRDTVGSIGGFFARYDVFLYPHRMPCDIDYQLSFPVPENAQGVSYILLYLSRLRDECAFLNCFDDARVRALLCSYYIDPYEEVSNLFEPVAACALARSLPGLGGASLLWLTDGDKRRLFDMQIDQGMLRDAAETLGSALALPATVRALLLRTALSLLPRIRAARDAYALGAALGCGSARPTL